MQIRSRIIQRIIVHEIKEKFNCRAPPSKFSLLSFRASRSPCPLTKGSPFHTFNSQGVSLLRVTLKLYHDNSLSLSFLFSLFLFVSRARCRFLCRHPYFSVAMKFRYEPLSTARSSGWIKEEETGLKETHNLAKEGIEKERERERHEIRTERELELIRTVKAYERLKCGRLASSFYFSRFGDA